MISTNVLILSLLALLNVSTSFKNNGVFPRKFQFGAGTSAYQIEGAWNVDGKGESMWDNLAHRVPPVIVNGDTGDVACNSYYRFKEDIQNVKKLGITIYRFSISWPRILPNGYADNINQKGLDYYKALVGEIVRNGLIPACTIYHWDLPQRVVDDGNDWRSLNIIPIIVNFARIVIKNLPDVKIWITINEPKQMCRWGYGNGMYPPMVNDSGTTEYQCNYIVLKAHAAVYRMYKKEFPKYKAKMTIVIDCQWMEPYSQSPEDIAAADRLLQFQCGVFYSPLSTGDWPEIVKQRIKNRSDAAGLPQSRLPTITKSDRHEIMDSIDVLTVNYYTAYRVRATEEGPVNETSYENDVAAVTSSDPKWTKTILFDIVPYGVYKVLKWIHQINPNKDILITEIGTAEDGSSLDDQFRIDFYHDHFCYVLEAMNENIKVTGIIYWSFMDNLEWRSGFSAHFGFYHVNASSDPTLTRTPKKSVKFVQNLGKYKRLDCTILQTNSSKYPQQHHHGPKLHSRFAG